MAKRIAILQSNYIPWKGYFDLIRAVDEFILFDDVQYTRSDWRNRNKIKTRDGTQWLTIPITRAEDHSQTILQATVSDPNWTEKHWRTIAHNYREAPFFAEYSQVIEPLYLQCTETHLSKINHRFITAICSIMGIKTKITWSTDYQFTPGKTERLVSLCRQAGADEYLSGPAAADYLQPDLFAAAGINLRYADYQGYPEYPQLFPSFEHAVSILDLIFNTGPDATRYMKLL